ncbi:Os01g0159200, partial [Oryza sativa Japonica Group]
RQPAEQLAQRADGVRADGQRVHVAPLRHAQLAVRPAEELAGAVPRAVHADPHVAVRHRQQPAPDAGRQQLAGAVPAQRDGGGAAGEHLHRRRQRHRRQRALHRRQPRRVPGGQGAAPDGHLQHAGARARAAVAGDEEEGEDAGHVGRRRARGRRRDAGRDDPVSRGGEGDGRCWCRGGSCLGERLVGAVTMRLMTSLSEISVLYAPSIIFSVVFFLS